MKLNVPFLAAVVLNLSTFTVVAQATPEQLARDYRVLRDEPIDYTVFGTICEQVARLRLAETYDPLAYELQVGIGYDGQGRTLGELDVVVIRREDNEAILVSEVKCWNDLGSAHRKAMEQLDRFQGHLQRGTSLRMYLVHNRGHQFNQDQFDERPEFITVSQDGGEESGFDMTLNLDMDEVKELRDMLMNCQRQGQCAAP